MTRKIAVGCLVLFLGFASEHARAAVPGFTLSASNVTMTNAAYTTIPFTLTSVDGFAGSIFVGCTPPNTAAGIKVPFCQNGPVAHTYTLPANGTATGEVDLYTYEDVVPGAVTQNRRDRSRGVRWALAGVVMLGLGMRRKRRLRSGCLLLAAGMLVGLTGISGCGSNRPTLTPGTYAYTLTATEQVSLPPGPTSSITVQVTVPPGIVIPAGT
jgi:hypothetical protein